jgi:hypothetical protein
MSSAMTPTPSPMLKNPLHVLQTVNPTPSVSVSPLAPSTASAIALPYSTSSALHMQELSCIEEVGVHVGSACVCRLQSNKFAGVVRCDWSERRLGVDRRSERGGVSTSGTAEGGVACSGDGDCNAIIDCVDSSDTDSSNRDRDGYGYGYAEKDSKSDGDSDADADSECNDSIDDNDHNIDSENDNDINNSRDDKSDDNGSNSNNNNDEKSYSDNNSNNDSNSDSGSDINGDNKSCSDDSGDDKEVAYNYTKKSNNNASKHDKNSSIITVNINSESESESETYSYNHSYNMSDDDYDGDSDSGSDVSRGNRSYSYSYDYTYASCGDSDCSATVTDGNNNTNNTNNRRNLENTHVPIGKKINGECHNTEDIKKTYIEKEFTYFSYSVGVVDIGIKPINKIKSKMEMENEICEIARRVEETECKT